MVESLREGPENLSEPSVVVDLMEVGAHDRVLSNDDPEVVVSNQVDSLVVPFDLIGMLIRNEGPAVAMDRQTTSGILADDLVSASLVGHPTSVAGDRVVSDDFYDAGGISAAPPDSFA